MEPRKPSEQELAALDIIMRGGDEIRGVVGTFAGEDAAFVVQVTEEADTGHVRVWPLAVLLHDEHLPFVGGPRENPAAPPAAPVDPPAP